MVRKFTSMNFKDYVANYPLISEEQISKIFNNLLKDSQDLVRMYLVDSLVALFKSSLMSVLLSILRHFTQPGSLPPIS